MRWTECGLEVTSASDAASPDGGAVEVEAAGRQEQRRRRLRQQRQLRKNNDHTDVVLGNKTRIKRRLKNLLIFMRVDQNLLDAYLGKGWKRQSREKIKPEHELQHAEARTRHSKLAIRKAIHELDDLGFEDSLGNAFDADGRIYHEQEFVGSHDSSHGKKRGRELLDGENQDWDFRDINDLDSEASYSDSEDGDEKNYQIEIPVEDVERAATLEIAKKREGCGLNTSFAKRQRVVETLDDYVSPTTLPSDWKEAVETITHGSSVPVIAICGAKNVGKSTFSRFLVNSLLNRYKEVAYLDTDVGQPEFTAPGCLSLHILDKPVVGPPATHLRTPESCFFYGDVTPKSNPLMYGEHVAGLVNYFREMYFVNSTSTIPLVINTHGWVKGIGFDVVIDILYSTSPTHVVQVLANSEKKNLPRNKFWDERSTAETIYVESAVEKLPIHHRNARSAHHLRAVQFLAYFQQCFGENSAPFPHREAKVFAQTAMSLVKDIPYEVPFSALKVKHLHSEVPPSESLRCVNATIVGLAVTSFDEAYNDLSRSSVPLCLGLGIVKAVDMRRGVFYISTPVPQEQLQHVDILLQGRVEIPVPLLMAGGFLCPYLKKATQIVEGVGAGVMKSTMKPSVKKMQ